MGKRNLWCVIVTNRRIFMYATHPTLVDQESFTFIKRGFDVYTAAWATKTRSQWKSEEIQFLPNHPYQGKCSFLDGATQEVLAKIDINMEHAKFYPDVQQALIENFDILYVSQITPWLLLYAREFLRRGKVVIFRTFGYPLHAWGLPHDFVSLWRYPTFYVLPTDPAEVELGVFGDNENVCQIMASIHPELIDIDSMVAAERGKFALTVLQIDGTGEDAVREQVERSLPWVCANRTKRFVPQLELDGLFNSCEFYLDPTYDLLRYSVFESIMHHKPTLVIRDKDMHKFMDKTGFSSEFETFFTGWDDVDRIKFFADNRGAVEQLLHDQLQWFNGLVAEAEGKWDRFLGEVA